ncbi:type I secretion system permease/ATPase [Erwinia papayae]|uniref:ABC-type xenobiotic transporter n=1 Tax=Erwinia papayae TaxID=206499 RepID=A0ABV3N5Y2_9GAMM
MIKSANELSGFILSRYQPLIKVALFSAVINLLMLTPSVYMLQIYDRVLGSGNSDTLLMLTLLAVLMFTLLAILEYIRSMVVIRLGNQLDSQFAARVWLAVSQSSLQQNKTDAGQMLNELSALRQFLTGSTLFIFFDAPWFPIYLLIIFLYNPWMGWLAMTGALLLTGLAILNEQLSSRLLKDAGHFARLSAQNASACLRQAEVIAAMGMLSGLKKRWYNLHLRFVFYQCCASERAALLTAVSKSCRLALQSLMLGLGAWLAIRGEITPGMMIAGSILTGRALAPIEQLTGIWKHYRSARLSWGRLVNLLDAFPPPPFALPLPAPQGHLSVENISCIPTGASISVLQNVSFSVQPGDLLLIAGPSASGKSCLARVLSGIWPVTEGSVRLDQADIHQWDRQSLGPHIGYLPQDVALFSGTVAENIARFQEIDAEKVVIAARMAGVHELILHFPDGYDTHINDGGAGLSGGQKQRIGLARALYGNPTLVVLDEPNASLDDAGEKALHQALRALRQGKKTVVVISHRPGLLSLSNHLLILDSGRVKHYGPTQTLLKTLSRQGASDREKQQETHHVD